MFIRNPSTETKGRLLSVPALDVVRFEWIQVASKVTLVGALLLGRIFDKTTASLEHLVATLKLGFDLRQILN